MGSKIKRLERRYNTAFRIDVAGVRLVSAQANYFADAFPSLQESGRRSARIHTDLCRSAQIRVLMLSRFPPVLETWRGIKNHWARSFNHPQGEP